VGLVFENYLARVDGRLKKQKKLERRAKESVPLELGKTESRR
jgi:hypothetical protein